MMSLLNQIAQGWQGNPVGAYQHGVDMKNKNRLADLQMQQHQYKAQQMQDPNSNKNRLAQLQLQGNELKNTGMELSNQAAQYKIDNPNGLDNPIDPTSHIQNYEYYKSLPEEGRAMFDNIMRAQTIRSLGGVDTIVGTGGNLTPLSTPQAEYDAKLSGAKATESGKSEVVDANKLKEKERVNQRTYSMFKEGMQGLTGAMSKTSTNPLSGAIPAVTANQQIAEGAIASIAPVLKQLFRGAGEGTFTDKDQEILLAMLPTRKDHPEAREAKIKMINNIVKAKLGITDNSSFFKNSEESANSSSGMSDSEYQARKRALLGQ